MSEITIDQGDDLVIDPGDATIIIDAPAVIQVDGGGGDVVGPAGATENAAAVFDGSTGKLIKEPNAAVDFGGQAITNVGNVDSRDVGADGGVLDAHVVDAANPHVVTPAQVGNGTAQWNADKLQGNNVTVDAPGADEVLTWNGSAWEPLPAAGGGVSGPGSSNNNAITRWDGIGGDTVQNSGVTVDDSNNVALPAGSFVTLGNGLRISSLATGVAQFLDLNGTSFALFHLGPATASFPMFRRNGANVDVRNGANNAYGNLSAALLTANSDSIRITTPKTPATAGAAGTTGQIAWDSGFIYVCVATNTWKRVAIATW